MREFNDRPRFFNLQFPPLWSSSPSISIVGKGFTILFGDLSSVVVNALSDASDTVVSAIGRWMPQTVDITGLQNSSPGLTYRVWSALKPSTLIAGTFDLILSSIRWYQQNSSCTMASKSSYSFANAFAIIDHAICSCYPDLLATYPRFKDLMAYLAISSVQNIVADRSSAIIFGYLISLGWIAAHNLLTARHNPYLVFILLKVCDLPALLLRTHGFPSGRRTSHRGSDRKAISVWYYHRFIHPFTLPGGNRKVPCRVLQFCTVLKPLTTLAPRQCGYSSTLAFLGRHPEVSSSWCSLAYPKISRSVSTVNQRYDQQEYMVALTPLLCDPLLRYYDSVAHYWPHG